MSGNKGILQNLTDAATGTAQYATDTAKGGLNFAGDTLTGAKDAVVGKSQEAQKNTPDVGKKAEEAGSQFKTSADNTATKVSDTLKK